MRPSGPPQGSSNALPDAGSATRGVSAHYSYHRTRQRRRRGRPAPRRRRGPQETRKYQRGALHTIWGRRRRLRGGFCQSSGAVEFFSGFFCFFFFSASLAGELRLDVLEHAEHVRRLGVVVAPHERHDAEEVLEPLSLLRVVRN